MKLRVAPSSYTPLKDEWLEFHFKENYHRLDKMDDDSIEKLFEKLDRTDKKMLCAYIETIANFYNQYKEDL